MGYNKRRYVFFFHEQVNLALKELNLAYNGFSDKGMIALADTLKVNGNLRELDVRLYTPHTLSL